MEKIIITQQDLFCSLWIIGWLFTIGYFQFKFWKGLLSLFIWPYYIGESLSKENKKTKEEVKS